jgi:hypothetical protein
MGEFDLKQYEKSVGAVVDFQWYMGCEKRWILKIEIF